MHTSRPVQTRLLRCDTHPDGMACRLCAGRRSGRRQLLHARSQCGGGQRQPEQAAQRPALLGYQRPGRGPAHAPHAAQDLLHETAQGSAAQNEMQCRKCNVISRAIVEPAHVLCGAVGLTEECAVARLSPRTLSGGYVMLVSSPLGQSLGQALHQWLACWLATSGELP